MLNAHVRANAEVGGTTHATHTARQLGEHRIYTLTYEFKRDYKVQIPFVNQITPIQQGYRIKFLKWIMKDQNKPQK